MPYIIEDGIAKLHDRSAFAGSIATTDVLVRTCVKKAGIPLVSAVNMITRNPARIMKLADRGELREGLRADVLVFDEYVNKIKRRLNVITAELHVVWLILSAHITIKLLIFLRNAISLMQELLNRLTVSVSLKIG